MSPTNKQHKASPVCSATVWEQVPGHGRPRGAQLSLQNRMAEPTLLFCIYLSINLKCFFQLFQNPKASHLLIHLLIHLSASPDLSFQFTLIWGNNWKMHLLSENTYIPFFPSHKQSFQLTNAIGLPPLSNEDQEIAWLLPRDRIAHHTQSLS